jgi:hypothetical protein
MSVVAAAVVGSTVVSAYSANKASKAQASTANTTLQFEQQKYYDQIELDEEAREKWEDMYGSIEDNLRKSIMTINKSGYEVAGHTNMERQFSDASRRLKETMAARGMVGSGIEASTQTQLLTELAKGKAEVSSEAQRQSESDKLNKFLSLGLPQKPGVQQLPSSSLMAQAQSDVGKAQAEGLKNMSSAVTKGAGQYVGYTQGTSITGSPDVKEK